MQCHCLEQALLFLCILVLMEESPAVLLVPFFGVFSSQGSVDLQTNHQSTVFVGIIVQWLCK